MLARVPIRLRLTFVFALAMAVVLAATGLLVYERVASDLESSLDQQLRGRAQDVSALVRRDGSLKSTGGALIDNGARIQSFNGYYAQPTRTSKDNGITPAFLSRSTSSVSSDGMLSL